MSTCWLKYVCIRPPPPPSPLHRLTTTSSTSFCFLFVVSLGPHRRGYSCRKKNKSVVPNSLGPSDTAIAAASVEVAVSACLRLDRGTPNYKNKHIHTDMSAFLERGTDKFRGFVVKEGHRSRNGHQTLPITWKRCNASRTPSRSEMSRTPSTVRPKSILSVVIAVSSFDTFSSRFDGSLSSPFWREGRQGISLCLLFTQRARADSRLTHG